ncbi:hypothetical protein HYV43_03140 [Candidatus Micrarchaeota archaeon]|nr:hypothetical protein [Candidatus Micrarchaeota archaeon]
MNRHLNAALLFGLVLGMFVLAGCTEESPYGTDGFGRGFGSRAFGNRSFNGTRAIGGPGFGNVTEEQRQQSRQQRTQAAIEACQGKAEGGACTLNSSGGFGRNQNRSNGSRTVEGRCQDTEGNLQCRPGDQRRPIDEKREIK